MKFQAISEANPGALDLSTPNAPRHLGNFTISSGLVSDVSTENAKVTGQAGCRIFVFERATNQLVQTFFPDDRTSLLEQFRNSLSQWLTGTRWRTLAVSEHGYRVCFTANYHLSNITLEKTAVTLVVQAIDPEGLATAVQRGADPIYQLCEEFKNRLSRQMNSMRLNSIDELARLRTDAFRLVDGMHIQTSFLRVTGAEIHIDPPSQIASAQKAQLGHEAAMAERRSQVALQYYELDVAGITDPHIRTMLADPSTKPEVLKVLLQARLNQVNEESARTGRVFDLKADQIKSFIDIRMNDQTTADELRSMLQLLDESSSPNPPRNHFEVLSTTPPRGALPPAPRFEPARFQIITTEEVAPTPPLAPAPPPASTAAPAPTPSAGERPPRFVAAADEPPIDEDALS